MIAKLTGILVTAAAVQMPQFFARLALNEFNAIR